MQQARLVENLTQTLESKRKCLMPYITAGFPNLDATVGLLDRFDRAGCPAVEIGFPFSDSIADGPVIQGSFNQALDAGFKVDALCECIASARPTLKTALVAMVSMSIVRRFGVDAFMKKLCGSGFDAVIVPDVPINESATISASCDEHHLCNILMCAPTTPANRQQQIAEQASGFLYVIAAKGITGERTGVDHHLHGMIENLRKWTQTPLVAGFGISTADHVRNVCAVADGAIVGSAIIRRIDQAVQRGESNANIIEEVGAYVDELMTGT
ncbi:MAG: tryptophan synthase subunit alpha [Planctomycetes bacterium]|nr:tryptophan synthase subunit alpha [Planctomycetota bacterium]